MKGFLVLEDGKVFEGEFKGNPQWVGVGEVVFNTSMVGYQEIVTDPSYYQQIIVMTAPEQGNYGVHESENESKKIWAEGFVCLEMNSYEVYGPTHQKRHQFEKQLSDSQRGILTGVDTRSLTLHLRERGTPWGVLLHDVSAEKALAKMPELIASRKKQIKSDWVYEASTNQTRIYKGEGLQGRVAVYDYGCKDSIVTQLQKRFKEVAVFNSRASAKEVLDWSPNGLVLSNGPGDPSSVEVAPHELKKLLGQVPIFGICMGHQILALALGGKTYKLKFGHRGSNHPVQNFETGEIYMTAQNHGYAVDEQLPSGVKVSQMNLYDKTVEGIEAESKKAWSVQYHPEAGPGPHDSRVLFDYFARKIL